MSASLLVFVFSVAHMCFAVATDPTCVAGDAGCASVTEDLSSLLATRIDRFGPIRPNKKGCIETPQEYDDTFAKGEMRCVSARLFGALATGSSIFPGHPIAFLSGKANLESFLSINKAFRREQQEGTLTKEEADTRITSAFAVLVGFPLSFIKIFGTEAFPKVTLTVFLLPAPSATAVVPSWEQLFLILEDFGLKETSFSVTRDLTLAYSKGKDPIKSFSQVTGCKQKLVNKFLADPDGSIRHAKCNQTFYDAIDATGVDDLPKGVDPPGGVQCIFNFQKATLRKKDPLPVTATTLRALFFSCIDANPLFTGLGLGFTNLASPLVKGPTTGEDRYTGREFVSANFALPGLNQVTQNLPDIPPNAIPTDITGTFLDPTVGFYSGCKWWPEWL